MTPSQGKALTTRRQDTARTNTRSCQGKGRAAREEARGRHGQNPRYGRRRSRGHREAIDKISRTGTCAVAGSIKRTPSRWLAPAGAVGIERGGGDSVARAQARGEGEGRTSGLAGSERPSHLVGLDQVGWRQQVGQGLTSGPGPTGGARKIFTKN
jgi:hypothetical protein